MFNVFKRITQLGVESGASFTHKKKITLINSMSFILFGIYFVFLFVSENRFIINNAIMAAVQVPAPILNRFKKHQLATYFFIYVNLLALLYLSVMYGYPLGANYALICWGLLVVYIFDKYKDMLPHVITGGISFVIANVFIHRQGPIETIPQDFVGVTVIGLCFFTPLIISRIYKGEHDEYQKIIQENNRILNRQSREILEQFALLEKRNQEIDRQKETIENAYAEIQSSMRYAQRIQKALLPIRSLLAEEFPQHCVCYKPKDIVSGDFYWLRTIGNYCMLAVADCTGHGVPGAFMNAIGNTLLNQIVNSENIDRPDLVLKLLNQHLTAVFSQNSSGDSEIINDGIEIGLCAINKENQHILFSSSKRPLYIVSSGKLQIFKGAKDSVDGCSKKEKDYGLQKIQYQPHDMLYMFSDGYADQFGGIAFQKMKIRSFRKNLVSMASQPAETQEALLYSKFDSWKGRYEQIDDVLVLGVRLQ